MKVSMGNYEMYEFGSTVTVDHNDLGYTEDDVRGMGADALAKEITEKCMEILSDQLAVEIEDARQLTDAEKSFLLDSFTPRRPRSSTRTRKGRRD
jgi:hypothetical protein